MEDPLSHNEPYLRDLAKRHVTSKLTLDGLAHQVVNSMQPPELLEMLQDIYDNVSLDVDSVTYGISCLLSRAALARYKELTGKDYETTNI